MLSRRTALVALSALLAWGVTAQARPLVGRHFVVVWGFEGAGPAESHTFAAFYRGDDLAAGNGHSATISWLPASGALRLIGIERGRNLSLGETLALAHRHHYRIASFGPYEISAETYARALARIRLLNSGKVSYGMLGGSQNVMNCSQAAGSINGPFSAGLSYGFAASRTVARHLALSNQIDPEAASHLGRHRAAAD